MFCHQQEIAIPAAIDNRENWLKLEQKARQLLERITIAKTEDEELSLEKLYELITPVIQVAEQIPQNDQEGADRWTNLQAVIEFFGTLIQNTLCLSLVLDTITGNDKDDQTSYSLLNISLGVAFGIMLAYGEIICHRIINTVNQNRNATLLQVSTENARLTFNQKIALSVEAVSHVAEVAAQYVILTRFLPNPNAWVRPVIYTSAALVGIAGSAAETRTHYNSILRFNSIFNRTVTPVENGDGYDYHAMPNDEENHVNGYRPNGHTLP